MKHLQHGLSRGMRALTTLLVGMTFLAASLPALAERELDRIVAVVNDDIILKSELDERLSSIRMRMEQQGTRMPPDSQIQGQVLEHLISEHVQLQRARMAGLEISDDELNQALQQIAQQNNISLRQLPQMLEQQGVDYPSFREEIRRELIQQEVQRQMLHREVTVSDREIQEFLADAEARGDMQGEYLVSHIMISIPSEEESEDVTEARRKAERLHTELGEGADFAELAVTYSEGQQALEGGSLGWRPGAELPSAFASRVVDMEPGEFTEPFRTSRGYHILKLEDLRREDAVVVEERRIRHILIRPDEMTVPEEAQLKLERLRQKLKDGADFAALADEYSDDHVSAADGGEMGWQARGAFVPAFDEALDQLEVGELSQPFQTPFGWHIAEVMEVREQDRTSEMRRQQAEQQIRNRKAQERMEGWLRQLREESFVEIRLDD